MLAFFPDITASRPRHHLAWQHLFSFSPPPPLGMAMIMVYAFVRFVDHRKPFFPFRQARREIGHSSQDKEDGAGVVGTGEAGWEYVAVSLMER